MDTTLRLVVFNYFCGGCHISHDALFVAWDQTALMEHIS